MADDVLINKAATIERCVRRAREEYARDPATFATDFTRQDAAILNIQRACEAALADGLKRMVGFRNIAMHDYQALQLPITVAIIQKHLDEFLHYSQGVLLRDAAQAAP
jgi:uncharacterized protein YutE (UPF0331/DUF86 family)